MTAPSLFDPIRLNDLELRNRIVMSPMCQYQATDRDGMPQQWHEVHYVSRAIGGVGLVMLEMTNVEPRGRITDYCLGLWNDAQVEPLARLVRSIRQHGAAAGIQIAHAGRKSRVEEGEPVAPSAVAFSGMRTPRALGADEIVALVTAFGDSARRAVAAGFEYIELHGAHGYLINQFLSPATNLRTDEYAAGPRFALEVIGAVRAAMPDGMPLFMRLSAEEYGPDGYSFAGLLDMAPEFMAAGVDGFDISSGGNIGAPTAVYPGYQLGFARQYREKLGVPVMAVGKLEDPALAEYAIRNGQADLIAIGRGLLRSPNWARAAAQVLGSDAVRLPGEYERGWR